MQIVEFGAQPSMAWQVITIIIIMIIVIRANNNHNYMSFCVLTRLMAAAPHNTHIENARAIVHIWRNVNVVSSGAHLVSGECRSVCLSVSGGAHSLPANRECTHTHTCYQVRMDSGTINCNVLLIRMQFVIWQ